MDYVSNTGHQLCSASFCWFVVIKPDDMLCSCITCTRCNNQQMIYMLVCLTIKEFDKCGYNYVLLPPIWETTLPHAGVDINLIINTCLNYWTLNKGLMPFLLDSTACYSILTGDLYQFISLNWSFAWWELRVNRYDVPFSWHLLSIVYHIQVTSEQYIVASNTPLLLI